MLQLTFGLSTYVLLNSLCLEFVLPLNLLFRTQITNHLPQDVCTQCLALSYVSHLNVP